jgi:hypothetical protein
MIDPAPLLRPWRMLSMAAKWSDASPSHVGAPTSR